MAMLNNQMVTWGKKNTTVKQKTWNGDSTVKWLAEMVL